MNESITVTLTRDNITIAFWVVNLLLLGVTAFYVYYAPIKAIKIGRQLTNDQNKYNSQLNLFLDLFSLRGTPLNYNFVNGLNQVQIVFQNVKPVETAWAKLLNEFLTGGDNLNLDLVNNYKTEMFSEMAKHLGYNGLQNDQILQPYYPKGHGEDEQMNRELRAEALEFLKTNVDLSKQLIAIYKFQEEAKKIR
jgi:hypothetical protein